MPISIYDSRTLKRIVGLAQMSTVPSFFILWGYLSRKYFFSEESGALFFKKKLLQFYPIYLASFLLGVSYNWGTISEFPWWQTLLAAFGLYYRSGMGGGGNIYIVVLFVILTVSIFKAFAFKGNVVLLVYCLFCMILAKILPHGEELSCYSRYFGYYAAFFFGAVLRCFDAFEEEPKKSIPRTIVLFILCLVGIGTPVLNILGVFVLEIEYSPNSPEHLCFCFFLLYVANRFLSDAYYSLDRVFEFNIHVE